MSCLMRHRLRNNTNRTLYLRVRLCNGLWLPQTRLDPYDMRRDFRPNQYLDNLRYFGSSTMIVIFVENDQVFGGLTPYDFVPYFELIFDIDEGSNTLIVSGILAESSDYFPCWCLPLWSCFTESGRLRDIVLVSGFKAVEAKNKGRLLSGQEMMTIYIMINYDGERTKNEEGGYIWSSGAHTKWEAILVDKSNLTIDGVADQICATLGLNGLETKLIMFCRLPENITDPRYIHDSQLLSSYLTIYPQVFNTIPQLHVKIVC